MTRIFVLEGSLQQTKVEVPYVWLGLLRFHSGTWLWTGQGKGRNGLSITKARVLLRVFFVRAYTVFYHHVPFCQHRLLKAAHCWNVGSGSSGGGLYSFPNSVNRARRHAHPEILEAQSASRSRRIQRQKISPSLRDYAFLRGKIMFFACWVGCN